MHHPCTLANDRCADLSRMALCCARMIDHCAVTLRFLFLTVHQICRSVPPGPGGPTGPPAAWSIRPGGVRVNPAARERGGGAAPGRGSRTRRTEETRERTERRRRGVAGPRTLPARSGLAGQGAPGTGRPGRHHAAALGHRRAGHPAHRRPAGVHHRDGAGGGDPLPGHGSRSHRRPARPLARLRPVGPARGGPRGVHRTGRRSRRTDRTARRSPARSPSTRPRPSPR